MVDLLGEKNMLIDEKVPAKVGMMSLIGASGKPPISWGNYFWLQNGPRVLNFWAENLQYARIEFLHDDMVNIKRYEEWCIIADDRIPNEWYYDKMCYTGGKRPPYEAAVEFFAYHGDPTNELESFTNPVAYYHKKGAEYNINTGIISYKVGGINGKR